MKAHFVDIDLNTNKHLQFIDINDKVKEAVKKSNVKNGFCLAYSNHTTASVKITENESSLLDDFEALFKSIAPEDSKYGHNLTNVDSRKNAHSHLRSLLLQQSEIMPVKDSKLLLGEWQSIFFIEFDGPRNNRKIMVEVFGE